VVHKTCHFISDYNSRVSWWLIESRLYVPPDTKYVISETFFAANFYTFCSSGTGMNTLLNSHKIYDFTSGCANLHAVCAPPLPSMCSRCLLCFTTSISPNYSLLIVCKVISVSKNLVHSITKQTVKFNGSQCATSGTRDNTSLIT